MEPIRTVSTSRQSAVASDIILREEKTVRLLFRPLIVENRKNADHSVKGTFVYQRKGKNDLWEPVDSDSLSSLKAGEGVKLPLHSAEVFKLHREIGDLYKIYSAHGVPPGRKAFQMADHSSSEVVSGVLKNPEAFKTLLKEGGIALVGKLLDWFAKSKNKEVLIEKLQSIDPTSLSELQSAIGLGSLKSVLGTWKNNPDEAGEEFWQKVFTEYPIVLEQLFSYPVTLSNDKAYVGGKTLDNTGGNIVDFLYRHKITDNIALVEIKTPTASLLGSEYRNGAYAPSRELSGAISQLLAYRESIEREFTNIVANLPDEEKFRVCSPKCILVIGKMSSIRNEKVKVDCFERIRRDSRTIEVVTFDEVFDRVERLISFVLNPRNSPTQSAGP